MHVHSLLFPRTLSIPFLPAHEPPLRTERILSLGKGIQASVLIMSFTEQELEAL
jgi:hypothetical protein